MLSLLPRNQRYQFFGGEYSALKNISNQVRFHENTTVEVVKYGPGHMHPGSTLQPLGFLFNFPSQLEM